MTIKAYNRFAGIVDELHAPGLVLETARGRLQPELSRWGLSPASVNASALFCLEDSAYERALEIAGELPNAERSCFPSIPGGGERPVLVSDAHGVVLLYRLEEFPEGTMRAYEYGSIEVYRALSVVMHYGGKLAPDLGDTETDVVVIGRILQTAPHEGPVLRKSARKKPSAMRAFCIEDDLVTLQKTPDGFYGAVVGPEEQAMHISNEEVKAMAPQELQQHYAAFVKGDFVAAVNTFLDELHYIDLPRHYIVESTPRHVTENPEKFKKREAKRVSRFQDRPHWLIMDPEEIRRTWPSGPSRGGTHAAPIPHFRRGHEKLLTGDRWTNKRGQIVRVRPTWVGDREWNHGAVRYRVVSRQGSKEDQA